MTLFRAFLIIFFAGLAIYTGIVVAEHGVGLLGVFFGDIGAVGWPGQFNLDFLGFLCLSALWVAWRHGFTAAGLGLGVLAFFGGMGFLTIYLLVQSVRTGGDVRALLTGASPDRTDDG